MREFQSEGGVSPVVGVAILVIVAVIAAATMYTFVANNLSGENFQKQSITESHIVVNKSSEQVIIENKAGRGVQLNSIGIIIQSNDKMVRLENYNKDSGTFENISGDRELVKSGAVGPISTDDEFGPGDEISVSINSEHFEYDKSATVLIINTEYNESIVISEVPVSGEESQWDLVVNDSDPDTYDTIHGAMEDAGAGDRIFVHPGVDGEYTGPVNISKPGVVIQTDERIDIIARDGSVCNFSSKCGVHINASGVRISNLDISAERNNKGVGIELGPNAQNVRLSDINLGKLKDGMIRAEDGAEGIFINNITDTDNAVNKCGIGLGEVEDVYIRNVELNNVHDVFVGTETGSQNINVNGLSGSGGRGGHIYVPSDNTGDIENITHSQYEGQEDSRFYRGC